MNDRKDPADRAKKFKKLAKQGNKEAIDWLRSIGEKF